MEAQGSHKGTCGVCLGGGHNFSFVSVGALSPLLKDCQSLGFTPSSYPPEKVFAAEIVPGLWAHAQKLPPEAEVSPPPDAKA